MATPIEWDVIQLRSNADEPADIRTEVREHYASRVRNASSCCGPDGCGCENSTARTLYTDEELALVPAESATIAYGCGNPAAIAALMAGEVVLDLGSGGGIDCFLAAQRVGPSGFVYGVDMTNEMVDLARRNAARHGIENVEFRKGFIEQIPLDDQTVDIIISNCVINLSPDKNAVMHEAFRVLRAGGRLAFSDIVIDGNFDDLPVTETQVREALSWAGCIAGALTVQEMKATLAAAGFEEIVVSPQGHAALEARAGAQELETALSAEVVEKLTNRFANATIEARRPL
jgi:ubiquinone/menaquinone biosynthesis C-methylase UbiE